MIKPTLKNISIGTPAYLLDRFDGAAAAYSVRLLRYDYSGSAIRVRRSSDNTEQDIGFSGLDLDTTSLESFCGAGDGFVVTWYDQSGNGNNATQATAANQPKIVSTGSVILESGKPALDFDGVGDWLDLGGSLIPNDDFAISVVVSADNTIDGDDRVIITQGGDSFTLYSTTDFGSANNQLRLIVGSQVLVGSDIRGARAYSMLTRSGNTYSLYINGSFLSSGENANNIPTENTWVGRSSTASRFYDGLFQEIIIYDSDKSSKRTTIEKDINRYFNIY